MSFAAADDIQLKIKDHPAKTPGHAELRKPRLKYKAHLEKMSPKTPVLS